MRGVSSSRCTKSCVAPQAVDREADRDDLEPAAERASVTARKRPELPSILGEQREEDLVGKILGEIEATPDPHGEKARDGVPDDSAETRHEPVGGVRIAGEVGRDQRLRAVLVAGRGRRVSHADGACKNGGGRSSWGHGLHALDHYRSHARGLPGRGTDGVSGRSTHGR